MDSRLKTLRHDLRGQLNSVVLCSSVLPITDDQAEILQFIDEIIHAATRAEEILDEIDALPPEAFLESPSPG